MKRFYALKRFMFFHEFYEIFPIVFLYDTQTIQFCVSPKIQLFFGIDLTYSVFCIKIKFHFICGQEKMY